MPKVRIDLEELDLDTLALIEEAGREKKLDIGGMRRLLANFMVGDDDAPLPADQADAAAGRLKLREVREAFDSINAALASANEAAVPKAPSSP